MPYQLLGVWDHRDTIFDDIGTASRDLTQGQRQQMGDQWMPVRHGADFVQGAVRAMGRGLTTKDLKSVDSFVTLWNNAGIPVFGRAINDRGRVSAVFPAFPKPKSSTSIPEFHVLQYVGSEQSNKFYYVWKMIAELASETLGLEPDQPRALPLQIDRVSPAVIGVGSGAERLGYANLNQAYAVAVANGVTETYAGTDYAEAYVLCKVHLSNLI